ncbi:MAG: DedA family protein [Alphaproteobacteria bacterium]|jgi:membrane protein DedA with SNARE-associated domain|nr:DedA family protein [Alphaproteobacteria bacterium]MBT5389336.1 DedA family protein [Alphaproteobacteria bacterium]MBT5540182.1 DedA family protein [Alphaproteobacteria bacterium]MBT5654441.1 DedA family protein [Alphaproteobacteria bacterium]
MLEQFIYDYGYWMIIVGALIEGEALLLLAGAFAYHGFFSLPLVMLISYVGAIIHDQLLFFLGRYGGTWLLKRCPKWAKKTERVFKLMKKYDNIFILGFRFIYGIRTITPIAIGMSEIKQRRYALLTLLAGAIWAIVISFLGYFFAEAIESITQNFDKVQKYIAAGVGVVVLAAASYYYFKKKIRKEIGDDSPPK